MSLYSPKRAIIVVLVAGGKFLAIEMLRGSSVVPMFISSSSVAATCREISISRLNASCSLSLGAGLAVV